MSILDIRPSNEYWNMKKRTHKNTSRKVQNFTARLFIKKMPETKEDQEYLTNWLKEVVETIKKSAPHDYSSPCRFTLLTK